MFFGAPGVLECHGDTVRGRVPYELPTQLPTYVSGSFDFPTGTMKRPWRIENRAARTSDTATWVDLDSLTPAVLRHLAAAKERASRPDYDDSEAMAEELAVMVTEGRRRTIGWCRRQRSAATSPESSPPAS